MIDKVQRPPRSRRTHRISSRRAAARTAVLVIALLLSPAAVHAADSHGPIGPRNVIYNCDLLGARKSSLVLSGANENWIVRYNRFESRAEGIVCRGVNFDHVIAGNVIIVRDQKPIIRLETQGETEIVIEGNDFYGADAKGVSGRGAASARVGQNRVLGSPAQLPPRPRPKVSSIYEWQHEEARRGRLRRGSQR